MPKVLQLHRRPLSSDIDLAYIMNGEVVTGVYDRVSGTSITIDGQTVTLAAGKSKTMTRHQAHTLFYSFMLITGWSPEQERTL